MKELTMFYLDDCGYCNKAQRALEELFLENSTYASIPLKKVEESREPELADSYDYYAVPSFFLGEKKLFEAHIGMNYESIKAVVRDCLNAALEEDQ